MIIATIILGWIGVLLFLLLTLTFQKFSTRNEFAIFLLFNFAAKRNTSEKNLQPKNKYVHHKHRNFIVVHYFTSISFLRRESHCPKLLKKLVHLHSTQWHYCLHYYSFLPVC